MGEESQVQERLLLSVREIFSLLEYGLWKMELSP
jgi:hypothetical protein